MPMSYPTQQDLRSPVGDSAKLPRAARAGGAADEDYEDELGELRKQYESYAFNKTWEIEEKRTARKYYHGDQWTAAELKKLKARGQPVITKNRIKKKINGIVGLVERLRQDPKAYPRTAQHEVEAELATMIMRYVLDNNRWEGLSSKCASDGGREGLGGVELGLEELANGDHDVTLTRIATDTFFYDARSRDPDFLDCLFMGVSKWADVEIVKQLYPDAASDVDALPGDSGGDTMDEDSQSNVRWMTNDSKRIRLVDHWHYKDGEWRWCLYTRGLKLASGVSPFVDEKNKTICKFIMYSAYVDDDGDRYGFIRDMKSTQDEINHRYSKALHLLNTRKLLARRGSIEVDKVRQESVKADGVIEWDIEKPEFDDQKQMVDMQGQLAFLEDNKSEIEMFGPNPQLLGQSENQSGRAIALLQQAGISELGPYIIEFKDWKLRVYRAVFHACRKHWSKERFIRVTDPQGEIQMVKLNALMFDQTSMQPQIQNNVAELDVDIIIDEGSDTINMMQDTFDTLSTLAGRGAEVPPGLLIELAPIEPAVKKKWLEKIERREQPDPMTEKAKALELEQKDADIAETKSKAIKNAIEALTKAPLALDPQYAAYQQQAISLGDTLDDPAAQPPAGPAAGVVPPANAQGPSPALPSGGPAAPGGPQGPPGAAPGVGKPPGAFPMPNEPGLPGGM